MFTGIIVATGTIAALEQRGGDVRARIDCPSLSPQRFAEGESICVSGVCLTALALDANGFSAHDDARSIRMRFRMPAALARYVARKGSVCIDGVSLTVNAVQADTFDVNIIPHTAAETTLGDLTPGGRVNLEVDLLARYAERLLGRDDDAGLDRQRLAAAGFTD